MEGCEKFQNFLQQVKQRPLYICTRCYQSLYQHKVRLFKYEKYHIHNAKLHHPMRSASAQLAMDDLCMASHT